jgi:CDP-paratose 2-epimerase
MPIAIVTGSAGLIGAEAVRHFSQKGFMVVGIDNNMRQEFFGAEASTEWSRRNLCLTIPDYVHYNIDIRDQASIENLFRRYGSDIAAVIHTAAQPSHDWAARAPHVDFTVNANGTLTMLEATRQFAPKSSFIFTSTNKVYGDNPNLLPLKERETRWEIAESHPYFQHGIDETFSIDHTKHSLFGASKLAADVLVQEYGRYFGMNTVVFRGGCLTGPGHSGTQLHGFLSYLVKCSITDTPYTIFGYKGKQVRDNIHSFDLVNMFWHYIQDPRPGEVYNAGGGRHSHCSMQEAISLCEKINCRPMTVSYKDENRIGDHIWWVSDTRKFQRHYPNWSQKYSVEEILQEVFASLRARLDVPATRAA